MWKSIPGKGTASAKALRQQMLAFFWKDKYDGVSERNLTEIQRTVGDVSEGGGRLWPRLGFFFKCDEPPAGESHD